MGLLAIFAAAAVASSPDLAAAKALIASITKAPQALQYRALKTSPDGLCGQFKAKEPFDGYAGFTPFFYRPSEKIVYVFGSELVFSIEPDGLHNISDAMDAGDEAQRRLGFDRQAGVIEASIACNEQGKPMPAR